MAKILVVDDQMEDRDFIMTILNEEENDFNAFGFDNSVDIIPTLEQHSPDLILLDYNMPRKNGADLIRQIRATSDFKNIPIIMVTGVTGEEEKVMALELGADDYVLKPFSPNELSARIRAVLRRVQSAKNEVQILDVDGLSVDLTSHKVTLDSNEIYLTLTEFRILSELLKGRGKVLSRDHLRQTALGNLNVTDRTIDVHMASLRKKLTRCADSIETVRGVGYRYSH